jgi:hypothetical protein
MKNVLVPFPVLVTVSAIAFGKEKQISNKAMIGGEVIDVVCFLSGGVGAEGYVRVKSGVNGIPIRSVAMIND